jgi:hypothetical protein
MTAADYYKHIRSLGPFPANQALELAREAAALDRAADERKARTGPTQAFYETQDGSGTIRLSFGVSVF